MADIARVLRAWFVAAEPDGCVDKAVAEYCASLGLNVVDCEELTDNDSGSGRTLCGPHEAERPWL